MAKFSKGQRVRVTSGREGVITFVALPTTISLPTESGGKYGRHLINGISSGSTTTSKHGRARVGGDLKLLRFLGSWRRNGKVCDRPTGQWSKRHGLAGIWSVDSRCSPPYGCTASCVRAKPQIDHNHVFLITDRYRLQRDRPAEHLAAIRGFFVGGPCDDPRADPLLEEWRHD